MYCLDVKKAHEGAGGRTMTTTRKHKDIRDVKNEYGYILRWCNGSGYEDGTTYKPRYYLENVETKKWVEITNHKKAIEFIEKKTLTVFRNHINLYDNYIQLFNILGIKER